MRPVTVVWRCPETRVDLPATTTGGAPEPYVPPEYCSYCGARLNPLYYFCTVCATPYKDATSVLPALHVEAPTEGELVAQKAPHVMNVFWTYMLVIVGASIVSYVVLEEDHPELRLFFLSGVMFITTCIFAALHWPALVVQFKRIGFANPAAFLGLMALVPLLAIDYYYHGWLIREFGLEDSSPLNRLRASGIGEPALIVFYCVLPAIVEETALRGLVQHWLQIAIRPWRAIVFASFLFTALHFSVLSAPYIFAAGMVLGWVKWKTGSLYPSMLIHLIHNLIVLEFLWP